MTTVLLESPDLSLLPSEWPTVGPNGSPVTKSEAYSRIVRLDGKEIHGGSFLRCWFEDDTEAICEMVNGRPNWELAKQRERLIAIAQKVLPGIDHATGTDFRYAWDHDPEALFLEVRKDGKRYVITFRFRALIEMSNAELERAILVDPMRVS